MASISEYYRLVKPGIVYGNMLHYVAGSLFAAASVWSWAGFLTGFVGTALLIASACIVNNLFDRSLDRRMTRTQHRPSVTGSVTTRQAVVFASILLLVGVISLYITNLLTLSIGIAAYVLYAFIYTYSKRVTVHHTLIGTVPGALPVVAGYTALAGAMGPVAWWLFAVVVLWQLPHFYAIGVYRARDYRRAGVPLLGDTLKPVQMRLVVITATGFYVAAVIGFAIAVLGLLASILFVAVATWWYASMVADFRENPAWSKRVFRNSLLVSLALPIVALVELIVG